MPNDPAPDDVERRAAELLEGGSVMDVDLPPSYVSRLVHQLQVHQIELEMQNDELQRAWSVEEEMSSQRAEMFDLAPVPYLIVGLDDTIMNVNAAAGELFGDEPWNLVGRRVAEMLKPSDRSLWRGALARALRGEQADRLHLHLADVHPSAVQARLAPSTDGETCRVVVIDT